MSIIQQEPETFMTKPSYSICITHYNNARTIERSLASVLDQIDDNLEVIVVDNFSTDGSRKTLEKYATAGKLKLMVVRCTRGKGRQVAFENSIGRYVIANFDLDDVMLPNLKELISLFHSKYEERLIRVRRSHYNGIDNYSNVTIAKRELIEKLGGWRDLNWYEDWDLWRRATKLRVLTQINFPILIRNRSHPERKGIWQRMRHRFLTYKECTRAGLWDTGFIKIQRKTILIYLVAWVIAKLDPLPKAT